jgi:hypothetical protein
MDSPCGQIETVACFQSQLLPQLGQAKRDAALHYIDDFIVGMRVRGIDIEWTV